MRENRMKKTNCYFLSPINVYIHCVNLHLYASKTYATIEIKKFGRLKSKQRM